MKKILAILFLALFLLPVFVFAQEEENACLFCRESGGLVPCGRDCDDPTTLKNECLPCTLCDIFVMIDRFVDQVLFNPISVLIVILIAGITIILAYAKKNSSEQINKAKSMLTGALIGLAILYCSWLMVNTFLMAIGITSWSGLGNWWELSCSSSSLPEPDVRGYCGDSIIQRPNSTGALEVCDRLALGEETCQTRGFQGGGTLFCQDDCLDFDTTYCKEEEAIPELSTPGLPDYPSLNPKPLIAPYEGDGTILIHVRNPNGAGFPYPSGDIACWKSGWGPCIIVERAIVGQHHDWWSPGWFNTPCDYVFGDGIHDPYRNDRPVLEVRCQVCPDPEDLENREFVWPDPINDPIDPDLGEPDSLCDQCGGETLFGSANLLGLCGEDECYNLGEDCNYVPISTFNNDIGGMCVFENDCSSCGRGLFDNCKEIACRATGPDCTYVGPENKIEGGICVNQEENQCSSCASILGGCTDDLCKQIGDECQFAGGVCFDRRYDPPEPLSCSNDEGCSSIGSFCDGNTPYSCELGGDGCYDRTNKAACAGSETCASGNCIGEEPPVEEELTTAMSIFKDGATFNFAKEYTYGQFANGDYWVLDDGGGVDITSVTYNFGNDPTLIVNPTASQLNGISYDIHNLQGGHSLIAMQSNSGISTECWSTQSGGGNGFNDVSGTCHLPWNANIYRASVLTVVSSVPSSNSFRPPFAGNNKTIYSTSDLRRNLLPSLSLSSKPSLGYLNDIADDFERPWLDYMRGYEARTDLHPTENMAAYGREMAMEIGKAATLLLLNYTSAQKEELLINFVQLGIDLFYSAKSGTNWWPDGGHSNGRKWPILFAGILFNNSEMKNIDVAFGEDIQTYFGQTQALWGKPGTSCYLGSGCNLELCPHGAKDVRDPEGLIDGCWDYRADSYVFVPEALAAHIMKDASGVSGKNIWDYQPFFDYTDRWVATGGGTVDKYIGDMWDAYRNDYGCTWSAVGWEYNCDGVIVDCDNVNSCASYPNSRARDYDPCGLGCK